MEVVLQAPQCESLPSDTFISMRIGDVQKQSRLSADPVSGQFTRTFKFPKPGDFRANFGRVEIYKRVGALTVNFDSPENEAQAVVVPCSLPDCPALPLQLSVKGAQVQTAHTPEVAEKMSRTKQRVDMAQQYLTEHNLEEVIADAMRDLIRSRPADPHGHLCQFIAQRKACSPEKTVNPFAQSSLPLPPPSAQKVAPVVPPIAEPQVPKSTPAPEPPPALEPEAPKSSPAPEPPHPLKADEPKSSPAPEPPPALKPKVPESSPAQKTPPALEPEVRALPTQEAKAIVPEAAPTLGDSWLSLPKEAWDLLHSKFPGPKPPPCEQALPTQEAKAIVPKAAPTRGDSWLSLPKEAWDLLHSKFPGPTRPDLPVEEKSAPAPEALDENSAPMPALEPESSAPAPEPEPVVEFRHMSSVGTWITPLAPAQVAAKVAANNAALVAAEPTAAAAVQDTKVDFTTSPSIGSWMMKPRGPLRGRLDITEHQLLPSVGTWCAQLATPEDVPALPQFAFARMPSVGTWLSAMSLATPRPEAETPWFQKEVKEMQGEEVGEFVTQLQDLVSEKDKEIERLKAMVEEFERMKAMMA